MSKTTKEIFDEYIPQGRIVDKQIQLSGKVWFSQDEVNEKVSDELRRLDEECRIKHDRILEQIQKELLNRIDGCHNSHYAKELINDVFSAHGLVDDKAKKG